MINIIDYALLSGASYYDTRAEINRFPLPKDWSLYSRLPQDKSSGFEASVYKNGSELVISFAGTGGDGDWIHGNIPSALGKLSDQLRQAADYYLLVKASAPVGSNITFTGHSLGGGLASLMAVMFGEKAVTFDQAPFRNAALTYTVTDPVNGSTTRSAAQDLLEYLQSQTVNGLPKYSTARLQGLSDYVAALRNAASDVVPNEGNVTNINVDGEILTVLPGFKRIGGQSNIPQQNDMQVPALREIELHSQALLTAFLQSDPNAATNTDTSAKTFNRVTFKLPELLKMIFDKNLFAFDPNNKDNPQRNFLEHIVRHQAGMGSSLPADDMVKRFTSDLWKLAQDGGMTISDGYAGNADVRYISKALTAFAMQFYYEDTANAKNREKQLFIDLGIAGEGSNGIRFAIGDVSQDIAAAIAQMDAGGEAVKLDLQKDGKLILKGYDYFKQYLETGRVESTGEPGIFTDEERGQIKAFLPYMRDWYVQAGTAGMVATDTQNRGAFMLGGKGSDTLTGGTADDLLVGNAGHDTLSGGEGRDILLGGTGEDTLKGGDGVDLLLGGADNDTLDGGKDNDILKGGAGNDTYVFTDEYGTDVITDSDGSGTIQVGGQNLGNATQIFDSVYKDNASGQIFVKLNGGKSLVIQKENTGNRILVNDWPAAGTLGISLQDKATEVPSATLTGDFKKKIDTRDPADPNDDEYKIEGGNYVKDGDEANALDLISGTSDTDVIDGGGGDDALSGRGGDDLILGGAGSDSIQGGLGKDTIFGGAGHDAIWGASDEYLIKPLSPMLPPPTNPAPNPQGNGFNWTSGYFEKIADGVPNSFSDAPRNRLDGDKGNIIDGGTGNDTVAAGTGADIVHGGEDNDFIFGMDEGDILFGDAGNDLIYGDGNQPGNNSVVWTLYKNHGNDVIDGGDGNDYLYGQGGSDIVFGGIGNDKIWGDEDETDLPAEHHGNDFLFGGAETDELHGGGGNDYLEGGTGSDKIWGGTGDDVYFFNAGDGVDELYDNNGERNIIRFGEGVDASKIKLKLGSLMLDLGNGDAIHIEDFDRDDVFSSSSITSFEFFDGSTLSLAELLERGFDLDGSDVNETIYGTNANDRIDGKGGTDVLIGGAGDDTYIFHVGDSPVAQQDGQQALEWVDDSAGKDTVALIDVDPSSIHVRMMQVSDSQPPQLVVQYGTTDQLLLKDGADGRIEHFQVGGETLSLGEFVGRYADSAISGVNENGQTLLNGGRSDDYLTTSQSIAVVSGGRGNDTLRVTGNDSTVLYSLGDGRDEVETGGTGNVLRLGEGISLGDIKVLSVYQNTLTLQVGNAADDILRFSSFNLDDPFTTRPFDTIEFADGTSFDFAEFIAQGFTLIGTDGNDLVSGLTGDDDLDGGAGNDVLRGGSGGDTYRFGLGSGHDTIDDRGNNPYDVDQLALGAGLAPDNLQFIHHGNDLIVRTGDGNDQVNILDHYAGHGVGAIAFNDGSMWSEADIDAHALDMFTLGTQQAAVTVVETSPLGAIVQLSAGLAFSDIVATQSGNDLLLQVRGTQSSLRLQNYYDTNPILWVVVDSLGAQSTMANLVDATIAAEANYVTSLQQDFLSWSRLGIAQQLADSGYTQNTDGSWYKTTSWVSAGNNKTVSDQTVTTQYTWYNGWAPSTTIQTNQTETWAVSGFYSSFGLGVETATVEHISLAGVDEIIGVETFEASQTTRQALADIHWVLESSRTLPSSQYSSSGPIYGNYGATVVGRSTSSTVTQNVEYQYAAYLDRPLSESSVQIVDNAYVSGYLPNKLPGTVDINSYIYRVAEINLTDGNHTVYADLNTLVVAGSGDNTIYNAGFAYGGVGNSSLIGGHILVAGQGNQTLEGGDIMVVGDGHDSVVANAGNTIEINPDNAEMDLVTSNANQSIEVADLYYRALGIDDWQERYQYGGQFRCDNDGEDIYLESAQDVLEFYQGWTSDPLSIQGLIDWGWVAKVQPLEDLVDFAGLNAGGTKSAYYEQHHVSERQVTATDFAFLDPYYESGQLISTLVKFGEGLSLSDLEFSWSQSESPSDSRLHAVLNLGWGSDQGIQIIMPNSSDAIGRGAYRFEFADGSSLSLGEMMALAPPAPDFNPDLLLFGQGAGQLSISPWAYRGIRMAAGLSPADLSLGQDGVDLVITSDATNDVLRIQNWYQSPDYQQYYPDLIFDDATRWSPTMLSRMATVVDGSAGGLTLSGLEGFATTMIAGTGDTLIGTHWGDVYVYGQGIGEIHIQDSQGGTVRFGAGIAPEMLTLDPNEMVIKVGDSGDKIYLDNVDPLLAGSGISVQGFEFADGSTLSYDQLTHRGWDIWGSSVNDVLKGTAIDDRMYGDAGDDTLQGGDGQDLLVGGTGNDLLDGGAGANTYVFNLGNGQDVIDSANLGTGSGIRFGVGITRDAVDYDWDGTDLTVYYGSSDSVLIKNLSPNGINEAGVIDKLQFDDGTTMSLVEFLNLPPSVTQAIDEQRIQEDTPFSLQLPNNLFVDEEWDSVVERVTVNGASEMPSWLTYDAVSRTLHGTPDNTAVGSYSVFVLATDSFGATNAASFKIVVENTNDAPVLANPLVSLTATEGVAFTATIPTSTFQDVDVGDALTYSATLADGSALPAWLTFDAGTRTFSGMPIQQDIGAIHLSIAATDSSGLAVSSSFEIDVGANAGLRLVGTAGADILTGTSGKDTLDGGTGADTLIGGTGDDSYTVDNIGDQVIENVSEGTDLVRSSVSYTLAANVEKLTLTGSAAIDGIGNTLDNTITGNAASNLLSGGDGNDTLSGGAGADTLIGGTGDDSYTVDNVGDLVIENAGEGSDLVRASVNYTLAANVEKLTLTGSVAIDGIGNELDNTLTGNAANNLLSGGEGNDSLSGGAGTDTLIGGTGDDSYTVDNVGDLVIENAGEGSDLVRASVNYTLAANVEKLTLTGSAAIDGIGNELDNILTGNATNNLLSGGDGNDTLSGGAGADTLIGGTGDDSYTVDNIGDQVIESIGEGTDLVRASVSYTLATNVEKLTLTGSAAIDGIGNELDNTLIGNAANNLLSGGEGKDTLSGGAGVDILEGGNGNDALTDTSGVALFNGGSGADVLRGGSGAEIFLGGQGNDTFTTTGGNDIILFNKEDGQDTFASGGTGSDTISLGGGITYADMLFTKATNDLVLKLGSTDQITFKNWYAATPSKPVANLQMIAEAMAEFDAGGSNPLLDQNVESFNFAGLAGAFDAARTANPTLTSWALTNALTSFQLAGSDTAALGGDLAYQYGKNGTLAGIGVTPALATLSDANLGATAQTLNPLAGLQAGSVRLS